MEVYIAIGVMLALIMPPLSLLRRYLEPQRPIRVLHAAAFGGNIELARHLISHGADVNAKMDFDTLNGVTPLYLAADADQCLMIEFLLANKADIDATDDKGRTALHRAAVMNRVRVVQLLLQRGANPEREDENGFTFVRYLSDEALHELKDTLEKE